jgi:hypothetical protein
MGHDVWCVSARSRRQDALAHGALLSDDLSNNPKSLRAFRTVPSRRVAAAPSKNIENNPMQSSRRPPQPTVWTENLTRRANQRHNFIIPEFAKRLRAQYCCDHVPRGWTVEDTPPSLA